MSRRPSSRLHRIGQPAERDRRGAEHQRRHSRADCGSSPRTCRAAACRHRDSTVPPAFRLPLKPILPAEMWFHGIHSRLCGISFGSGFLRAQRFLRRDHGAHHAMRLDHALGHARRAGGEEIFRDRAVIDLVHRRGDRRPDIDAQQIVERCRCRDPGSASRSRPPRHRAASAASARA